MRRIAVFAALATVSIALSGCMSFGGSHEPASPAPQQTASIDGSWVDPNGIVSTFRNGTFETRTTDTNSVLATGTYVYQSQNLVQIALHSRLRNTDSTVNCALISPTQLNCTSSTGSQFSLMRAGAGQKAAPTTPTG